MSTQSVLEGILSTKIVPAGSGYEVQTDITNVNMVKHSTSQCGNATIVSGSQVTINNTAVISTSLIFTTLKTPSITPLCLGSITPGVSFIVKGDDGSAFNWFIAN